MNFIVLILAFAHELSAEDILLPDGRLFKLPTPEEYPYILKEESPSSLERLYILSDDHSNAALSCPKDYSMLEIIQELVFNHNITIKDIAKRHTASLLEINKHGRTMNPPCPVIYDCLGYQACLFRFSHHFCQDLSPASEYSVLLTIVCYKDGYGIVPSKFKKKKDLVLHIYETIPSVQDISNLRHQELSEDVVFTGHCNSFGTTNNEGYAGNCHESPPSNQVTAQYLWPLFGRTLSEDCRNKLGQVYCALQYNTEGFCVPPIFHENSKQGRIFNSFALPENGYRPRTDIHALSMQNAFATPIRLAFMVMVFNRTQSVMDLIGSIYREQYFYVIHVDKHNTAIRKELTELISQSSFPVHNIFILPEGRSFITPETSYETVRAQLEGFEELLRLGSWDFVINLSDGDIPLRNVDDLAAALMPYRGSSFLSSLHLSTEDESNESSTSNEFAYSACDGFVYKVSSKGAASKDSKFRIYKASRGGAFSRNFIEYLVNETMRSATINKYQFHLQTDIFPDESYIPTVLMNSPFKNTIYLASIQSTKHVTTQSFLSDFYVCHQHPEMECNGIEELISMSHHSFFVRFPTQPLPEIKMFARGLAKEDYYQLLEKYFPSIILKTLAENALEQYCAKKKLPSDQFHLESVLKFHIIPSLIPHDSCCKSELISSYSEITDFTYWIDINLFNRTNGEYVAARLMLQPSYRSRFCFGDGNLRMAFISPWVEGSNSSIPIWSRFGLEIFSPLPYGPAFNNEVLINLLFSEEIENSNCGTDPGKAGGTALHFSSQTNTAKVNLLLISPDHTEKCATDVTLFWDDAKDKTISSHNKKGVRMKSILMHCKKMQPGQWTLHLHEVEPIKSKIYKFPIYLLDFKNTEDLDTPLKDVVHLWELKHFAFTNKANLFDLYQPEIRKKDMSSTKFHHKSGQKRIDLPITRSSGKPELLTMNSGLNYWFICGGGFASTFSVFFTLLLFCFKRYFRRHDLVWIFILSLILVVLLQIALFLTLCEQ